MKLSSKQIEWPEGERIELKLDNQSNAIMGTTSEKVLTDVLTGKGHLSYSGDFTFNEPVSEIELQYLSNGGLIKLQVHRNNKPKKYWEDTDGFDCDDIMATNTLQIRIVLDKKYLGLVKQVIMSKHFAITWSQQQP